VAIQKCSVKYAGIDYKQDWRRTGDILVIAVNVEKI